jgi:hypothetical protein
MGVMDSIGSAAKKKVGLDKKNSGKLAKLQISFPAGSIEEKDIYTAFLNPNQLSHSIKVNFSNTGTATITGTDATGAVRVITPTKPVSTDPESLNFELLLDATGATGTTTNIPAELKKLSGLLFKALASSDAEKEHTVQVFWNKIITFIGHVESFDVSYLLFSPDGVPLRATVKLSFLGESKLTEVGDYKRNQTTKELDVNTAKTLVSMCNTVYNSPIGHIAVAKANKLTNIRKLAPGTKLVFPPKKA